MKNFKQLTVNKFIHGKKNLSIYLSIPFPYYEYTALCTDFSSHIPKTVIQPALSDDPLYFT
jgi:hypothetical protein